MTKLAFSRNRSARLGLLMGLQFSIVLTSALLISGSDLGRLTIAQSALAGEYQALFSTETEGLLRLLLKSDSGAKFARTLLGAKVTRFNNRAPEEVLFTLAHPENRALSHEVRVRLEKLNRATVLELKPFLLDGGVALDSEAPASSAVKDQLERMARAVFGFDKKLFKIRTADEIRKMDLGFALEEGVVDQPQFASRTIELTEPPVGFKRDAIDQLLTWEEQANVRIARETTQTVKVPVYAMSVADFELMKGSKLSAHFEKILVRDGKVMLPFHPYVSENVIQELHALKADTQFVGYWPGRMTASRSIVIWDKKSGILFSLKAPTDFPHATTYQPEKAELQTDIAAAVKRSDYFHSVDLKIGSDPKLGMLKEIFTAAHVGSKNGIVIREMTQLQDGHFYLPAMSIPFAGRDIAKLNGVAFDEFWAKGYARVMGRSKAKLLLRYGLQMETPNCQNVLIQLDRNMVPTGKLVFRDISDAYSVKPVMEALGETKAMKQEIAMGYKPMSKLNVMTENSFWRLNEDPVLGVNRAIVQKWEIEHDQAYMDEVLDTLGYAELDLVRLQVHTIEDLQEVLFSQDGLDRLRNFRLLAEKNWSQRKP